MKTINGDARQIDLAQFDRYQTIVADPPWWYGQRLNGNTVFGRGAGVYDQMTTDEICAMPIAQLSAPRCHLYLWATAPLLPDALRVMDAWQFSWATIAFVWVKMNRGAWKRAQTETRQLSMFATLDEHVSAFMDNLAFFGPGFYTGSNVELVLLGRRGQPFAHAEGRKASQVVFTPRGEHSTKPERVQDLIEWMYPQATPRLELFGRRARKNWTVFGNEV